MKYFSLKPLSLLFCLISQLYFPSITKFNNSVNHIEHTVDFLRQGLFIVEVGMVLVNDIPGLNPCKYSLSENLISIGEGAGKHACSSKITVMGTLGVFPYIIRGPE